LWYFLFMPESKLPSFNEQASSIRIGTLQDVGALALVLARANAKRDDLPLPTGVSQASCGDLEGRMNIPGAWTHVAVNAGKAVGFALGYPSSEVSSIPTDSETDYLSLLMVEPEFWGRGVASSLLDSINDYTRQANKQHLVLWTRQANNSRTQSVYLHKGYKLTGKTRDSRHGPQFQFMLDL
jgi:GNAT superfamily N-acetyltransferase